MTSPGQTAGQSFANLRKFQKQLISKTIWGFLYLHFDNWLLPHLCNNCIFNQKRSQIRWEPHKNHKTTTIFSGVLLINVFIHSLPTNGFSPPPKKNIGGHFWTDHLQAEWSENLAYLDKALSRITLATRPRSSLRPKAHRAIAFKKNWAGKR